MNTLVIFDSKYGNTKQVAEVIAQTIRAKAVFVDKVTDDMLDDIEVLIVGSPTQAWHASSKTKEFIKRLKTRNAMDLKAATFDTGFDKWYAGSAAKDIAKQLRQAGCNIIAKPKHIIVEGMEGPLAPDALEQAKQWALEIRKNLYN